MQATFALLLILLSAWPASAQSWQPLGPPGGDVRSLAADPNDARRVYLGVSDGHVFGSRDAGEHWERLGRAGHRLDSVVAAILVDPRDSRVLYAATWTQASGAGGGVFRSADAGRTWQAAGLVGQAVRALAQAPSHPDVLVAGTLDGVYRSNDGGRMWTRISPAGHREIRNLDSVAIDPQNPDTIYVGTFHLPWKTTDGGQHWFAVHSGMIDDSDVMSILIDRTDPQRIYASACSGIYRSENGARLWKKIQGIPFTARRTHVIRQDPQQPAKLYAGTTQGLWKTTTAGAAWQRMTPADWVITALVVSRENPKRVVIGTERLGVLVSDDGGEQFRAANEGFFHRQLTALALDHERPGRLLVVVGHAPEPVLVTEDGGATWVPLGAGLRTQSFRQVYASPAGWWAALARGGLVRFDAQQARWIKAGIVVGEGARFPQAARDAVDLKHKGLLEAGRRHSRARSQSHSTWRPLRHVINDMAFSEQTWFAATAHGLLASTDRGSTWSIFRVGPLSSFPVRSVRASSDGQHLWVVSLRGMVFSHDAGRTWSWHDLPPEAGGALRLEVASPGDADSQTIVAIAKSGLYLSRDAGRHWSQVGNGLPAAPVRDIAVAGSVLLAAMQSGGLYVSYDRGQTWTPMDETLAELYSVVLAAHDAPLRIFAVSATEGVYLTEWPSPAASPASKGQVP